MLPKKVALAVKDIPLAEIKKSPPQELKQHLDKLLKKNGADLAVSISRIFAPLRNRTLDDFPANSIASDLAREGRMFDAVMQDQPTFNATMPIAFERQGSSKTEIIGSGVLIHIENSTFLLTAAHVSDFANDGDLLIPGKEGFMSLSGHYISGPMPTSGKRSDDHLDVAFVRLDSRCVENLNSRSYLLREQDFAADGEMSGRTVYTFAGFPWRRTKVENKSITTEFQTMSSTEAEAEEYSALGLKRSHHIVIRFNREMTYSSKYQRKVVGPLPNGMSGGGIYGWTENALRSWPVRLPLVGIANAFIPDKRLLVGTRLSFYLRCIRGPHVCW